MTAGQRPWQSESTASVDGVEGSEIPQGVQLILSLAASYAATSLDNKSVLKESMLNLAAVTYKSNGIRNRVKYGIYIINLGPLIKRMFQLVVILDINTLTCNISEVEQR